MSTRSALTIWSQDAPGATAVIRHSLYRHSDGGVWGNGYDLSRLLPLLAENDGTARERADALAVVLLSLDRGGSFGPNPVYRVLPEEEQAVHHPAPAFLRQFDNTDWEYYWDVFTDWEGGASFRYARRPIGGRFGWKDGGTVRHLRHITARELAQVRKRINARRERGEYVPGYRPLATAA